MHFSLSLGPTPLKYPNLDLKPALKVSMSLTVVVDLIAQLINLVEFIKKLSSRVLVAGTPRVTRGYTEYTFKNFPAPFI